MPLTTAEGQPLVRRHLPRGSLPCGNAADMRHLGVLGRGLLWEPTVPEIVGPKMAEKMPDAVRRAWGMQSRMVKDLPSAPALEKLQEALQCFQYGFCQASIVLCRCVLEHALRERLKDATLPANVDHVRKSAELAALIQQAEEGRILAPTLAKSVHEVRRRGNRCVHDEGAARSEYCRVTPTKTRHLLAHLCS